ncbi:DUF5412 family protein [Sporosarcina sp. SG10008]|uniref:DUF5412 family protein n=1 Tax=unclassified Sporosarcina TaxID=2647733 RepID=UPI0037DC1968
MHNEDCSKSNRENQAKIVRIDSNTVSINGVELNVQKDVYDWREQERAQLRFAIQKCFNTKGDSA